MKPLSQRLPYWLGGGYFGVKENASLQTSGNAASGLSAGINSKLIKNYIKNNE